MLAPRLAKISQVSRSLTWARFFHKISPVLSPAELDPPRQFLIALLRARRTDGQLRVLRFRQGCQLSLSRKIEFSLLDLIHRQNALSISDGSLERLILTNSYFVPRDNNATPLNFHPHGEFRRNKSVDRSSMTNQTFRRERDRFPPRRTSVVETTIVSAR